MLQNTFVHIPKITANTEIDLWKNNIHTWQDFLDKKDNNFISNARKALLTNEVTNSIDALNKKNFNYFSSLPANRLSRMSGKSGSRNCLSG